ncbi:S24 family peptidase [Paraburkholderia atlantica]|uniref:S24 family peptidase n=1 Tax=Paraburkholderia atlantica TaxID=2654982 RepID=UPI0017E1D951|nr:S24 family peptidase [Paraburkholderia atlantica]MBB5414065.1 phage repressor protein C with HTH and peptisase S24 domain [Paraburkholderia atlantica]
MKTNDEIRRENLLRAIKRMRTASALAEKAGVAAAYLSQIKKQAPDSKTGKPKAMGDDVARKIERAIGEREGWMDVQHTDPNSEVSKTSQPDTLIARLFPDGQGNVITWAEPEDLEPDDKRVWIDRYDYRFSAGTGVIQWEVRQKKALPFDVGFFRALGVRPQDCKLAQVHGRSMEPYLFNRDMMMICIAKNQVKDGLIYAVVFEDEPLVKQIFKEPEGAIRLHSYNPEFPDKVIHADQLESLQIAGEVIYRSGSGLAGGN